MEPTMSLLRHTKLAVLSASRALGLDHIVLNSSWRQQRLLIVCWHNISIDDEHIWDPALCVSPDTFRSRLDLLRSMHCNVLPFGQALTRLREGTLPPRAVALTIDDGDSSVYLRAWPMLREFGFAATLYWTTYYSTHPYAVFDPMVSYLLWKGRGRFLQLREPLVRRSLKSSTDRAHAFRAIYDFARMNAWSAERKEAFLADLSQTLEIDYPEIKTKRILHLISPAEAHAMVAEGLDLQLHTHRHRVPRDVALFSKELADNARVIREVGANNPSHFCYPSGSFLPEFAGWLRNDGVVSATTCQPGFVRRESDDYFLPRLLDKDGMSLVEFAGWISGVAAKMFRQQPIDDHSFR
jgi:peptidoglycan/xylan/chitin deacetylase (PgdA/CDA1 family)